MSVQILSYCHITNPHVWRNPFYQTSLTEVVVLLDVSRLLVVEPREVAIADAGTLQSAQDAQDVTWPHVHSQFVDVRGDVVGRHVQGR